MPDDVLCQETPDGRFKVGDRVTITLDWAHRLRSSVYGDRKTMEHIRSERTGKILEIWTGGHQDYPWCSVKVDCSAPLPWESPDDLEFSD